MRVRGWLLVLCILLTVWNPATLAFVAASAVGNTKTPLALSLLGIRLVVTSVGVAAGLALWNKRLGSVKFAKVSLMLSGIEVVVRLSTRVGLSQAPPGTRLPLALALIVYNGVWYLYLEKSRRVSFRRWRSRPSMGGRRGAPRSGPIPRSLLRLQLPRICVRW